MSLELDWLEREERYRRRVVRLIWIFLILAGGLLSWSVVSHSRAEKRAAKQTAAAAEAARLAEEKRARDAVTSDSTAAANRLARFMEKYKVAPIENTPLLQVPLPAGVPVHAFVETVWTEYARVLDPLTTAEQTSLLFREHYVDVMNDGPLRPSAILLPPMKQQKTTLSIDKVSFPAITRGQVTVGWREPLPEPAADSLKAAAAGQPAAPGEQPAAATGEGAPAEASTPSTPVPEQQVPAETPAPATPAPPDTTRKP
jgi:hypothetical protein